MFHSLYANLRPRWQLATDVEEAGNSFAELVRTTYKESGSNKSPMLTNYEIDQWSNDSGRQSIRTPVEEQTSLGNKTVTLPP